MVMWLFTWVGITHGHVVVYMGGRNWNSYLVKPSALSPKTTWLSMGIYFFVWLLQTSIFEAEIHLAILLSPASREP